MKYDSLPGDMPPSDAAQLGFFAFTGAQAGKVCVGAWTATYGNNDGIVNIATESYPFWSHLSDAKMIKGNYGGTAGNLLKSNASVCFPSAGGYLSMADAIANPWKYLPYAKLREGLSMTVKGNHYYNATSGYYHANTNKLNMFSIYDLKKFSAYVFYQIDSKMDDGLPASGNIRVSGTGNGTATPIENAPCTTTGVTPIQYDLSQANGETPYCTGIDFLF